MEFTQRTNTRPFSKSSTKDISRYPKRRSKYHPKAAPETTRNQKITRTLPCVPWDVDMNTKDRLVASRQPTQVYNPQTSCCQGNWRIWLHTEAQIAVYTRTEQASKQPIGTRQFPPWLSANMGWAPKSFRKYRWWHPKIIPETSCRTYTVLLKAWPQERWFEERKFWLGRRSQSNIRNPKDTRKGSKNVVESEQCECR